MTGPTAVVVDDDRVVTEMMRIRLERSGWEVREARNAEEALEVLEVATPDVLITDHVMPGMTGFEFAITLRERGYQGAIIVLSAALHDGVAPDAGPGSITTVSKRNLPALWDELRRYGPVR